MSIYELLEENNLVSEPDLEKIIGFGDRQIAQLHEKIYTTIYDWQNEVPEPPEEGIGQVDPFRFMASASMRGDSTCSEFACRIEKIDFLARFAALYSTEITVPVPLRWPEDLSDLDISRRELVATVLTLFRLRPLVESGIILPAVLRSAHCEHTIDFAQKVTELLYDFSDWSARQERDAFTAVYQLPEKSPSGRSTLYLDGPSEFLEHGSLVFLFDERENWRLKSWKYDSDGRVEIRGPRKLEFIKRIFEGFAANTSFYLAYARFRRSARLLTDLPGEGFLLNWLTDDKDTAMTAKAMEQLDHVVPILADLPIATVLRIRREERDSFERYREAIRGITTEILSKPGPMSGEEARELLRTRINPEIGRLKSDIQNERTRQKNRILGGTAALAAAVGISAFGHLPLAASIALAGPAATIGTGLLGEAAKKACNHRPDLRQTSDFYFLLRLAEEAQAV